MDRRGKPRFLTRKGDRCLMHDDDNPETSSPRVDLPVVHPVTPIQRHAAASRNAAPAPSPRPGMTIRASRGPCRGLRVCLSRLILRLGDWLDETGFACCERCFYYISPVITMLGVVWTFCIVYAGVVYAVPLLPESRRAPATCVALYSAVTIYSKWLVCCLTNPGNELSQAYVRIHDLALAAATREPIASDKRGDLTDPRVRCRKSGLYKPPRAHYDATTKRLILNFDHFCPWVFNSIGYNNYRHFVGLLLWFFVGTSFGAVVVFEPCRYSFQEGYYQSGWFVHAALLFTFLSCVLVAFAVGLLLAWHLYLAGTAQTGIDHLVLNGRRALQPEFPNPWDSGSVIENYRRALLSKDTGVGWFELALPPFWPSHEPYAPPYPGAYDLDFYS